MAGVKWYFKKTPTFSALSGYTNHPGDNEVELGTSVPSTDTLGSSIDKGSDEVVVAGGTDAAPHDSADLDWSALVNADSKVSVDVTATNSDLTFNGNSDWVRWNSSGAQQSSHSIATGFWSSDADTTGVKVATATDTPDLGTAVTTDLYGAIVDIDNGGHMVAQTLDIGVGADSWVEFSGGVIPPPPELAIVCGAECQIINEGAGEGSLSHWHQTIVGDGLTSQTSVVRSGARAWRFESDGTFSLVRINARDVPDKKFGYARFYIRFPSGTDFTPGAQMSLARNLTTTGADEGELVLTTGGEIKYLVDNVASVTNTFTPVADVWYGIEFETEQGVGGAWRVKDGDSDWSTSESISAVAAANTDAFILGLTSAPTGFVMFADDLAAGFSDTREWYDASGTNGVDGKVLIYRPNADGTHDFDTTGDFTKSGSDMAESDSDGNTHLDDADMEQETEYIGLTGSANGNEYVEFDFDDEATEDDPRGVSVVVNVDGNGSSVTSRDLYSLSDDGFTSEFDYVNTVQTTASYYQFIFGLSPSGSIWTRALVNSMQIRLQGRAVTYRVHGVALEVEWTAEPGPERVPYYRPMKQLLPQ